MMVIVEGMDCVGKTTFVSMLQDAIPNHVVLHAGPPESIDTDPFEEYEQTLHEHIDAGVPIICDRWHWGEKAYGPIFRGHDRLTTAGWRHIELFLAAQGAVVVYIHQPRSVIEDCLSTRGDAMTRVDHLVHIEVGYQWCVRNSILPVFALRDPNQDDAYRVAQLALVYAHGRYFPSRIGRHHPAALLFGEQRGGTPPHADRAAFVPRKKTSGYHLLSHLPERLWGQVGLANALEDDPMEVWHYADRPPIVALGGEASRALAALDMKHATVPHPQFVRRFLHSKLPQYGPLIQRVIGTDEQLLSWRGDDD